MKTGMSLRSICNFAYLLMLLLPPKTGIIKVGNLIGLCRGRNKVNKKYFRTFAAFVHLFFTHNGA